MDTPQQHLRLEVGTVMGVTTNYLDIAQSFLEHAHRACSVHAVSMAFGQTLQRLGFRYYACASHVDPLHPDRAVMVLNYPRAFVEQFSREQWHRIDPVFHRADRSSIPFHWDSPSFRRTLNREQLNVLKEAGRFGLAHGYTIPIHAPGHPLIARASCSVVPDSHALHPHTYFVVSIMAGYLFDAAWRELHDDDPPGPTLTPRERECLEWVARGKDQSSIALLLNISPHTVHAHLENARQRLGATSAPHAVALALSQGLIKFGHLQLRHPRTTQLRVDHDAPLPGSAIRATPSHKN